MSEEILSQLKQHNREILTLIGEDPNREGLIKTPERVAKAMLDLTRGYEMDPVATLNSAKFQEPYNQMVIVRDIEFYSLCELRQSPRGLYSSRLHHGTLKNRQSRRYLCTPPPSAGTTHYANQRLHTRSTQTTRRHGGNRSTTPLHANERCGKIR